MKEILLRNKGMVALVDDNDFDRVSAHRWTAELSNNIWYAHRGVYLGGGRANCKIRKVKMHRFILGIETGSGGIIDHINGNGLDNRRCNLRLCTHSDNIQRGPHKANSTGFLGVYRRRTTGGPRSPFCIMVSDNGKRLTIAGFQTAEEAAREYDRMVIDIHGVHARTNFPVENYATR